MGETSLVARVDSIILLPTTSNQTKSGSVRVFEPEPSDKGDLEIISCRTLDAAMKMESSGNDEEWNKRGQRRVTDELIKMVLQYKRTVRRRFHLDKVEEGGCD